MGLLDFAITVVFVLALVLMLVSSLIAVSAFAGHTRSGGTAVCGRCRLGRSMRCRLMFHRRRRHARTVIG